MERFSGISFVVIAFNVRNAILRCLESIAQQTSNDYEVVIVDDASSDGTQDVVRSFIEGKKQFRFIEKRFNEGAHLARRTGVFETRGDYVIFVDGDDEIAPSCVEVLLPLARRRSFDILKFGLRAVAEGEEDELASYSHEQHFNRAPGAMCGRDILEAIFANSQPLRVSWCLTDNLFPSAFIKNCFELMTSDSIGRVEDAYEMFVVAAEAEKFISFCELRYLIYHFGAGFSGRGMQALIHFEEGVKGAYDSLSHVWEFAKASEDSAVIGCCRWFEGQIVATLASEWTSRVRIEDEELAFDLIAKQFGDDFATRVLLGPLNGRLRWLIEQDDEASFAQDEYMLRWEAILNSRNLPANPSPAFQCYMNEYRLLKEQIENRLHEMSHEQAEGALVEASNLPSILGVLGNKILRRK